MAFPSEFERYMGKNCDVPRVKMAHLHIYINKNILLSFGSGSLRSEGINRYVWCFRHRPTGDLIWVYDTSPKMTYEEFWKCPYIPMNIASQSDVAVFLTSAMLGGKLARI